MCAVFRDLGIEESTWWESPRLIRATRLWRLSKIGSGDKIANELLKVSALGSMRVSINPSASYVG